MNGYLIFWFRSLDYNSTAISLVPGRIRGVNRYQNDTERSVTSDGAFVRNAQ